MTDKKLGYVSFEKRCVDNIQLEDLNKDLKNGECKIFVGNVPYQCTQEEFARCFQNVDGFIKAEIITVHKTNMSRGFGFVTMRSLYDAENLKQRDDILFKGRALRFTSYQNENSKPVMENLNNYVFVDGIPDGKNREWLRNCFSFYEPIGRCFITMNHENGEMKNNGVIEIIDDSKYKSILAKKWHEHDNVILETSKYRTKLPHMLGSVDDSALSQSHTHNTGQVNVYNNNSHNTYSRDRSFYDRSSYIRPSHRFSCDRSAREHVSHDNSLKRNKNEYYDKDLQSVKVIKKRSNKNDLFDATLINRKSECIVQGV